MKHRAEVKAEPAHRRRRDRRKGSAFFWGLVAALLAGTGSLAVASWTVGLAGGSNGEGQSASVSNLTITAVASPAATNLLYPGGNGDVVVTITNPNSFPVSLSAVNLPTNTTYATGYSNSALTTAQAGCTSTLSLVAWNYSTGTSGSSHTLTTALVVAASGTLVVTLTNDASMGAASPTACQGTYFSMPALTGVTASATTGSSTASPTTDSWTS